MKITYWSLDGYEHTAYMDDDEDTGGVMRGEEKHTDAEVWIIWSDERNRFLEVAAP